MVDLDALYEPEPNSGCWIWLGSLDRNGYGRLAGRGAHRRFYERVYGKVPAPLVLDHKCRVRCCVNPAHLEPVTSKENILRGVSPAAQNARKTHCEHGHELSGATLYVMPDGDRACRVCRNRVGKISKRQFRAARITEAMRSALLTAADRERHTLCPVVTSKGLINNSHAEDSLLAALARRGLIEYLGPVPILSEAGLRVALERRI